MEKLRVELGPRSYDISIGRGTLGGLGEAIRGMGLSPRMAVISNPTVFGLYGEKTMASLRAAGFEAHEIIVPDGEEYKSLLWVEKILGNMLGMRLDRSSAVVALGGGVIGDMAGFAASVYMRGIRFVQVPTTLLAQVDSSVGGKTGVNHELGKNMIGAFWQPSLVWVDTDTLKTLPMRELIAGVAEVVKYGVIWDREFFDYLLENRQGVLELSEGPLARIIRRSCEIKAEVVSRDEREAGLRAILNYGHTIGHAIENVTGYTRHLHGECVAMGMCAEALLSVRMGIMDRAEAEAVSGAVRGFGLPHELPGGLEADALVSAMEVDKKTVAGTMRFVLPERVGSVRVNEPVERDMIKSLIMSPTA
jgi:3-dehydroquinate synthase